MRGDEQSARERARNLIDALPDRILAALRWRDIDLTAAAEHLLYTAILRPGASPKRQMTAVHSAARAANAGVAALRHGPRTKPSDRVDVIALVTQPIHAELFAQIERELAKRGAHSLVVDAETRKGRSVRGAQARMAGALQPSAIPSLMAHAIDTAWRLSSAPDAWSTHVPEREVDRLWALLARGIPILALDAARVDGLLSRHRPGVVACFSESGQLARIVPAVGRTLHIPVVDLPHAEAADPWGSAGLAYDAVAVYGPRAAEIMRLAGVATERIRQIGPLRHDALVAKEDAEPPDDPRRVLFAAQPTDEDHPALRSAIQRTAMEAAVAVTAQLEPAELIVLPHPTQHPRAVEELLGSIQRPPGMAARVERDGSLHTWLAQAWLLVTASSQSVFDAVLAGVPAMTVTPTGIIDPVTFAHDGIALGVGSAEAAAEAANQLRGRTARDDLLAGQRAALGGRIGLLDGRAAERAAMWLLEVSGAEWPRGTTIGRQ